MHQAIRLCRSLCLRASSAGQLRRRGPAARRGFSLVEAIIALSITAMAGAVLLLAVESTLNTTTDSVQGTIADGLAQQILDEIVTKRFVAIGGDPLTGTFGPSSGEASGAGRSEYNDTDDFHNFVALPAEGRYGEPLGAGNDEGSQRLASMRVPSGFFDRWRQRVEVYFVDPTDHRIRLTSGSSYFRAIEVNIELVEDDGTVVPLATRKRVIAYVQPPG
jgi:hypothetical protein